MVNEDEIRKRKRSEEQDSRKKKLESIPEQLEEVLEKFQEVSREAFRLVIEYNFSLQKSASVLHKLMAKTSDDLYRLYTFSKDISNSTDELETMNSKDQSIWLEKTLQEQIPRQIMRINKSDQPVNVSTKPAPTYVPRDDL